MVRDSARTMRPCLNAVGTLSTDLAVLPRAEYPGHPQRFLRYQNTVNAGISDHFHGVLTKTPFKLGGN